MKTDITSDVERPYLTRSRFSPEGFIAVVLLFTLLLLVARSGRLHAQALHPEMNLTQPTVLTMNRLHVLRTTRPAVAIFDGAETASRASQNGPQVVQEALYHWELLLLGLNVPYRTIDERDLSRGISNDVRILILPVAEVLSERQQRQILRFVERGGGVIASGRVGAFDERGRPQGDTFFRELFGADLELNLPDQPAGLLHSLGGGTPLTDGLPPGFRLNISPQVPISAARPATAASVGRPHAYADPSFRDPFDGVSMILYHRFREGRAVWTRFHPQDVSRDLHQQRIYQAFVVNTFATLTNVPRVTVRQWPDAGLSATVFVMLPELSGGSDFTGGSQRAIDALASAGATATFVLTSSTATRHPEVVRHMAALGEITVSADTDDVLKKQAVDVQQRRIETALTALGSLSQRPITGIFPPGGFYDVSTVRALSRSGLQYVLLPVPGESEAPGPLRWHGDADYREPLALHATAAEAVAVAAPRALDRNQIIAFPTTGRDDYTVLNVLRTSGNPDDQFQAYRHDFLRVHANRGLYVMPFRPGFQALSTERAAVLGQLAELATRQGSWVTTLGEVHAWWQQLQQLTVQIVDVTERSMTLDVLNRGATSVSRVTLDVRLPQRARAANATEHIRVVLAGDGETVTLTLPTVRPGANRFTLSFDTR